MPTVRDDDDDPELDALPEEEDDADRLQRLRRRFARAVHVEAEPSRGRERGRDLDPRELRARFDRERLDTEDPPERRGTSLSPKARRGRLLLAAMALDLYTGDTRLSMAKRVMELPLVQPKKRPLPATVPARMETKRYKHKQNTQNPTICGILVPSSVDPNTTCDQRVSR